MASVVHLRTPTKDLSSRSSEGESDPGPGHCLARCLGVECGMRPDECLGPTHEQTTPCSRKLRCGQHLFWTGDAATQIWMVRKGSLKIYGISGDSEERVTGFFFAGDIVGWDALACGVFQFNAMALEQTVVTRLSAAAVLDGALGSPQIQAHLLDGIRTEFVRLESMLWLEHRKAEERLAAFLLWISASQTRNGGQIDDISLPMSRHDIGSYLGLATETVSRRLALFHRNGWITLRRRRIHINDPHQLQRLSECQATSR